MGKTVESMKENWEPRTPEDVLGVRAQLDLMLSDPLFSQSRRYPTLLRRIVEDSLAGRTDSLKERVLGMEIFDRPADYDTNADAIVRVTAAEIRKRIAQYYHDERHNRQLRIDLPVGGYVAVFRLPQTVTPAVAAAPETATVAPARAEERELVAPVEAEVYPAPLPPGLAPEDRGWLRSLMAIAAILLVSLLLAALWLRSGDTLRSFWKPLIKSPTPTVICVGQLPLEMLAPQAPTDVLGRALLGQKPVSISDTIVVSNFATFLGGQGMKPRILVSTQASFADLRNAPLLLVGGLDNSWTMRMLGSLRYRMQSDPVTPTLARIYDAEPSQQNAKNQRQENWTLDFGATSKSVSEDYAIVARFNNHETEDTVLIAAGLGENGTSAAEDFLTHAQYLDTLGEGAPKNWRTLNVEAVLRTRVIDGKAGPAEVVAKYFW